MLALLFTVYQKKDSHQSLVEISHFILLFSIAKNQQLNVQFEKGITAKI
jgi:hypothetical protein